MPFATLDGFAKKSVRSVQDYATLSGRAISNIFRHPRYVNDIFTQTDIIGVGSIPIVILTGFFTGGVLALQSASSLAHLRRHRHHRHAGLALHDQGARARADLADGLRPQRLGMASELGSMMVTEQIDAMRALGTDPSASWSRRASSPPWSCSSSSPSSPTPAASSAAPCRRLCSARAARSTSTRLPVSASIADVLQGLIKPLFFGFIIATIGCFYGMRTTGGTQGVGRSTTQAVVVCLRAPSSSSTSWSPDR